ncbi:MAG: hypothetical protein NPINA01_05500 [Nitrospinaceae bacterium]|nr:MAG: hypothetical protein NPINA01_05500 [Nitrospinaceae bacterium]
MDKTSSTKSKASPNSKRLFKHDKDWWHNACLNYSPDSWDLYASGYKDAADTLIENVIQTQRNQDLFVFPVVFLYRQYLELRMKKLIQEGNNLFDISIKTKDSHKLDKLWKQTRGILEKVWPDEKNDLDSIETLINEFSQVDPTSTAFRYPVNLDGKASIEGLSHINLRNLLETMGSIAKILDGAFSGIVENLSIKRDMLNSVS